MAKYINVDEFIERHAKTDMAVSMMTLVAMLREEPAADVIPVNYVREWYKDCYGIQYCPLVDDWRKRGE